MKLLLDQNLSYRLISDLETDFPASKHVKSLSLDQSSDSDIWDFAKKEGYCIVTKDSDFHQRSFLSGHPPKVILVQRGNVSTVEILNLILRQKTKIWLYVD